MEFEEARMLFPFEFLIMKPAAAFFSEKTEPSKFSFTPFSAGGVHLILMFKELSFFEPKLLSQ